MGKDKSEKKEKKDKKRKHSDVEEVAAVAAEPTPSKKEKKDKKRKSTDGSAIVVETESGAPVALALTKGRDVDDDDEGESQTVAKIVKLEALVPFANPLCDDKALKKVLKSVKKAAKSKALKRGVKECVKSIRKSPVSPTASLNPTTSSGPLPVGIVVLAADISPMDVISHIPVLCEDHNIPYVYVPSRAELGAAGSTKRPTSVVMVTPKASTGGKKRDGATGEVAVAVAGDAAEWEETYRDLHKLALKMGQTVKV